jgi:hypothetical protein
MCRGVQNMTPATAVSLIQAASTRTKKLSFLFHLREKKTIVFLKFKTTLLSKQQATLLKTFQPL